MKRLLVLAALAVAMSTTSVARAAEVSTGDVVKVFLGAAGADYRPFRVDNQTNPAAPDFLTFCLEFNELFSANTPYFAKVSDRADSGGPDSGDPGNGAGDPISPQTAWLYHRYRTDLGFQASVNSSNANLIAFQNAIWALEDEIAAPAPGTNSYYDMALASTWTDIGNVRVMQLWTSYQNGVFSGYVQDMLTIVPEPGSLAMLGVGLLGLAGAVRRRTR